MAQSLQISSLVWNQTKVLVLGSWLALLGASCSKVEEEPLPPEVIPERPLMLFSDTTFLDFYEGKQLSWKLKTAWLERWGGEGRVFARPVLVDIYDSLGAKAAFLRSDSGELDSRMSYVRAFGHVYALTPKGASVRADSLVWNKRENKVHTESFVRVVSENGDVLQGLGFESDARLENWQIKANVTGIFQDAADRMKEEDQKERSHMDSLQALSSSSRSFVPPRTLGRSSASIGAPMRQPLRTIPGALPRAAREQLERQRRQQEQAAKKQPRAVPNTRPLRNP